MPKKKNKKRKPPKNKNKVRTLWTHRFINKVIPDKRNKKDKHKKQNLEDN